MFNLDLIKAELSKYSTIEDCSLYNNDLALEIKCKNSTGKQTTYNRIETDYILPYYETVKSFFGNGYYKAAFVKRNIEIEI